MTAAPFSAYPESSKPDIGRAAVMCLLAIALVYGGFYIGRALLGSGQGLDFAQYYMAGCFVLSGEPLTMYDTGVLYQIKAHNFGIRALQSDKGLLDVMTYAYPPAVAYLMTPLSLLPYNAARYLFSLVTLVAVIAAIPLLFANREHSRRLVLTITGWAALLIFSPLHRTLHLGQINGILFLCLVLGLYFARKDRAWLAGIFVALAIHIKLFPLILLPFFLIKRQFKLVGTTLLWIAVIAGLTAGAGGPALYLHYFRVILPSQYEAGAYFRNQGLGGFFARLLTTNEYVHSLGNHPALARFLTLAAGLVVLAVTFLAMRWRQRTEPNSLRYDLEYGSCFVAALLFLSKSYDHMGMVLLFAFLFLFEALVYTTRKTDWMLALLFSCFAVRSFVLTLESEWYKLPTSLLANPLFSIHFFAMLATWVICVSVLRGDKGSKLVTV